MKILLLAPHPFYQERGTPIAVDLLIRALVEQGHEVDVLTYHEGDTPDYPGPVRVLRIKTPPLAAGIRPGFSVKKLICDAYMAPKAARLARENRYDLIHAVEESVFFALGIAKRHGIPCIYDMDSSLAQQMVEKMGWLRPFAGILNWFEARALKRAAAVAPMCEAVADLAREHGATRVTVLHDVPLFTPAPESDRETARRELGIERPCVMYVGNLEQYQGIDLLLQSFALVHKTCPNPELVIVGGAADDVTAYKEKVAALGLTDCVRLIGPRPVEMMARLFVAADVLVSPRAKGVNTPMKIYSYMLAGRPIVATDIQSHTQVLTPRCAQLAAPEPRAFAAALEAVLSDDERAAKLGNASRTCAEENYSRASFNARVKELYAPFV